MTDDKKPDGGPAFPTVPIYNGDEVVVSAGPGMTLRDWFAGQALIGFVTTDPDWSAQVKQIASRSFRLADALIAERDK